MSKINKIVYLIMTIIFFTLFDITLSSSIIKHIESFTENAVLDLVLVQNTGAAFSILQNSKFFLVCFSIVALVLILSYVIKKAETLSMLTIFWTSMLMSGIFCNLYERISLGYVRDFFKLTFVNFPVFNISDIFINISVFAIVVIIIKQNFSKNNETRN